MALAKAVPANKHSWKPMEGTRSFHEVFAHVAAEGNTETAMFGGKLPEGSLADFDAEEARLSKLPDDQLIAVMEKSMKTLSATVAGLSLDKMNTPITYYGQSTLPRVATTHAAVDRAGGRAVTEEMPVRVVYGQRPEPVHRHVPDVQPVHRGAVVVARHGQ